MSEPAAGTPDVPFVDPAVLFNELSGDDTFRCQVRHVLQQLVDHIRDDLQDGQGMNDWIGRRRLERFGSPDPEWEQAE